MPQHRGFTTQSCDVFKNTLESMGFKVKKHARSTDTELAYEASHSLGIKLSYIVNVVTGIASANFLTPVPVFSGKYETPEHLEKETAKVINQLQELKSC